MNGEQRSNGKFNLPTTATPYIIGLVILVLIILFSLYSSIPFANKSEIESMKLSLRSDLEWIKLQQSGIKAQIDGLESDRRKQGNDIAEIKSKGTDTDRRLLRLEESIMRRRPGPGDELP